MGCALERGDTMRAVTRWWRARTSGPTAPRATVGEEDADPGDVAELDRRLAAIDAEHRRERDRQLVARLRPLIERQVPVRCVEPVRSLRAARLRFADGTAVLVRGELAGDVGVLAAWTMRQTVLPRRCSTDQDGTHLELRSRRGRLTVARGRLGPA